MSEKYQLSKETRHFGDDTVEVAYRKIQSPADSGGRFPTEIVPGVTVQDDILIERDIAVKMRDGITIYTDIYRPEGGFNLPAIIAWSPYGKRARYINEAVHGVPLGTVSPMAKFEAPDPAYWCHYGYAVINPDIRGTGNSEGDMNQWGLADGYDGYDFIEWLASQKWCNGKIGMSGNSYLAISQWFIAAEKPPHLAAIAPWEGFCDLYRDACCMGGIPETGFNTMGYRGAFGPGRAEDLAEMMKDYPCRNGYWDDKSARIENIEIPAYVAASYNPLHAYGTFDAYRRLPTPNKWLRVHNTQEWPDLYTPEYMEDLRRFFDRYLKGIRNGWEMIPKVRVSILDPGGTDQVNRAEKEWPLERTQYQKLYLNAATRKLSTDPVSKESEIRYRADDGKGEAVFTVKFEEDTEITGYMKLRLWVEADGADDMDIFVYVCKLNKSGEPLLARVLDFPNPGVRGMLRVSHRELDEAKSTQSEPYQPHRREQFLKPKEIVPVEIGIWPIGMLWHAGQQLSVTIKGFNSPWLEDTMFPNGPIFHYEVRNKGEHIFHTGGKYDSHLLIPKIPR